MFKTKPISSNVMTTPKPPKIDNVLVNVVAVVTTRNQQLEYQVFEKRKPVKAKKTKDWQ